MSDYDPRRARTKRAIPMWLDAFVRDTLDLEADEVGGYFLIIGAMWSRPTCDLPNDPRKLARICRVSVRLWKSRVGASLMDKFEIVGDRVISKRLRKEATYTERQGVQQHCRKTGDNPDKYLKLCGSYSTADISTDTTAEQPTQEPTYKRERGEAAKSDPATLGLFTGQEKEPEPEPDRFEEFWQEYPHRNGAKKGKAEARQRWDQAIKKGVQPETIVSGAIRFQQDRQAIDNFAPDPARWIFRQMWANDVEPPRGQDRGNRNPDTTGRPAGTRRPGNGDITDGLMAGFAASAIDREGGEG